MLVNITMTLITLCNDLRTYAGNRQTHVTHYPCTGLTSRCGDYANLLIGKHNADPLHALTVSLEQL